MKKLLTFFCFLIGTTSLVAQQEQYATEVADNETNIQRYGLDYELIDYTFVNGDSTILNELDITANFHARLLNDDLVLTDIAHNVKILLYSESRMRAARGLANPDHTTKLNEQ